MIVVTGGAGFIGSAMVHRLNENGITDILIVDELGSSPKWKNLVGKRFTDYLHKDPFMEALLAERLPRMEAIIHMGANSSTTETDVEHLMDNNYRYTRVLAEWALRKKVRFIYASSGATYGDGTLGFSDDDEATVSLSPLNPYGYSKHLFDLWLLKNKHENKMVGIKFFNVFGPNEYHKNDMRSVVCKAYDQIQETGKMGLFKSYKNEYKDGEQMRDFVYIKDCTEVLWWFLNTPKVNGLFNLGRGEARTWNDLAKAIFAALKKPLNIEYIDMPETLRSAYQYHTQAVMTKLQNAGCPVQFQSLEDSVKDYVEHYLHPRLRWL
ncbi:MAG: ADP-glyceromanno-heptose 6-epimerase [Chlamydiae bacterium]|nr:ADP-glyceromanno-heptose 6-epimerase [Chlamydiota bacterium]MBI3266477.1 ADP-glyceromanno-heptose 6-epimerase [Chlamydiota bacterium]